MSCTAAAEHQHRTEKGNREFVSLFFHNRNWEFSGLLIEIERHGELSNSILYIRLFFLVNQDWMLKALLQVSRSFEKLSFRATTAHALPVLLDNLWMESINRFVRFWIFDRFKSPLKRLSRNRLECRRVLLCFVLIITQFYFLRPERTERERSTKTSRPSLIPAGERQNSSTDNLSDTT